MSIRRHTPAFPNPTSPRHPLETSSYERYKWIPEAFWRKQIILTLLLRAFKEEGPLLLLLLSMGPRAQGNEQGGFAGLKKNNIKAKK